MLAPDLAEEPVTGTIRIRTIMMLFPKGIKGVSRWRLDEQ